MRRVSSLASLASFVTSLPWRSLSFAAVMKIAAVLLAAA